jgi:hypothetical protein
LFWFIAYLSVSPTGNKKRPFPLGENGRCLFLNYLVALTQQVVALSRRYLPPHPPLSALKI